MNHDQQPSSISLDADNMSEEQQYLRDTKYEPQTQDIPMDATDSLALNEKAVEDLQDRFRAKGIELLPNGGYKRGTLATMLGVIAGAGLMVPDSASFGPFAMPVSPPKKYNLDGLTPMERMKRNMEIRSHNATIAKKKEDKKQIKKLRAEIKKNK